jgi:hypothetical protein
MRACVGKVFTLEINLRAAEMFCKPPGKIEGGRSPDIGPLEAE